MAEIEITDFPDVRDRARELGLPDVEPLALLPIGFDRLSSDALAVAGEASTLRKLLREAGLAIQVLSPVQPSIAVRKSADLILPTVFVAASLWSQNPIAVQLAIDVIGSYVTDALKGLRPSRRVKLSVAVETNGKGTTKLLTYEGPVEGISNLAHAIEKIANAH